MGHQFIATSRFASVPMLIAYVGHAYWQSSLYAVGWTWHAWDPPFKLLVRGDSAVGYVVATITIEVQTLWCHSYANCKPQHN